ncbi:hypothetical protein OC835_004101, partial [Tilletia horrida]
MGSPSPFAPPYAYPGQGSAGSGGPAVARPSNSASDTGSDRNQKHRHSLDQASSSHISPPFTTAPQSAANADTTREDAYDAMDESADAHAGESSAQPAQGGTEGAEGSGKKTYKKRTHARRTCIRCQKLKTNCEKCVSRAAPCIVNDRRGPKAPPPGYRVQGQIALRSAGPGGQYEPDGLAEGFQPAEHFADGARTTLFPGGDDVIWHTTAGERLGHDDSTLDGGADGRAGGSGSGAGAGAGGDGLLAPAAQVFAVVRPLALLSHLVNGIISKSSVEFETNFGSPRCTFVNASRSTPYVLDIIEQRFELMLGWTPHLPSLQLMQHKALTPETSTADNRFLLSVAYYVSLMGERDAELITEARKLLKADVIASTLRVLTSLPASVDVAHGLVLLATHSTIDFEMDRSSTKDLIPGRGLIAAARTIAAAVDLSRAPVDIMVGTRGATGQLRRDERLDRLSRAALWMTICLQESHITLSRESLMNASLDRLYDVDERMLVAFEREATLLLNNRACAHIALAHRVRVFKKLDGQVRGMYLMGLPSSSYDGLLSKFRDLFAEFDQLRKAKDFAFVRFTGPVAEKIAAWLQIEMDGIEETICQRFSTYVSIGTFLPPPMIDTRAILRKHMTHESLRDFSNELFRRNEITVTRHLSLFAHMSHFLSAVPQVVTFAFTMRAAKVILEQSTARMIGWNAVPDNVETLELLITSAARALGGPSAGGNFEAAGAVSSGQDVPEASADMAPISLVGSGGRGRGRGRGRGGASKRGGGTGTGTGTVTGRGRGRGRGRGGRGGRGGGRASDVGGSGESGSNDQFPFASGSRGLLTLDDPAHASPMGDLLAAAATRTGWNDEGPAPWPEAGASQGGPAAEQEPTLASLSAQERTETSGRAYSFSTRFPCGSAESVPLICTYLLHEIAIALNRRTKLFRLLNAQLNRSDAANVVAVGAAAMAAARATATDDAATSSAAALQASESALNRDPEAAAGSSSAAAQHGQGAAFVAGSQPSAAAPAVPGPGQMGATGASGMTGAGANPLSAPPLSTGAAAGPSGSGAPSGDGGASAVQSVLGGSADVSDVFAFSGLDDMSRAVLASIGFLVGGEGDAGAGVAGPSNSRDGAFANMGGAGTSHAPGTGDADLAAWDPFGPQAARSRLLLDSLQPASWIDAVFQAGGFT